MPVCIAGMHRSGTSMVARILNLLGVNIGPEDVVKRAGPDNEAGFWEDPQFVELNDELLAQAGGAWDDPPHIDWGAARFDELRQRASCLIESFDPASPWGWKDPRNSLTLPFWRSLIEDLLVVVVVRNPVAVTASLQDRNGFPREKCLILWRAYNEAALATVPWERRLVTHYDSYFADPKTELRQAADFLGTALRVDRIPLALDSISHSLRHHEFDLPTLSGRVDTELVELYRRLLAETRVRRRPPAVSSASGLSARAAAFHQPSRTGRWNV